MFDFTIEFSLRDGTGIIRDFPDVRPSATLSLLFAIAEESSNNGLADLRLRKKLIFSYFRYLIFISCLYIRNIFFFASNVTKGETEEKNH